MGLRRLLIISLLFVLSTSNTNIYTNKFISLPSYDFMHREEIPDIRTIEELKEFIISDLSGKNRKFTKVVDNYYLSDTVWRYRTYNNKGIHLGNDYETTNGANIYAPVASYVIKADDRYTRAGYLGCTDGYFLGSGGNELYTIAQVGDKLYGFIFMHCKDIVVEEGQFVKQGSIIAHVGNTGNTNSNHLHLEMYYLGDGDILDYIYQDYDVDFGIGRGYKAYSNRCEVKDSAPCILDSRDYIGE